MFRIFLICTICYFLTVKGFIIDSRVDTPYFRSDYKYEPSQDAFYKLHPISTYWREAQAACRCEGSSLVVPESKAEIEVLLKIMNENLLNSTIAMLLGIHDIYAEGVYVTVDGKDFPINIQHWNPGEPNDFGNQEDCIHILRSGTLNDFNCNLKYPFICKKNNDFTINNLCNTADSEYFHDENTNRCYKLHTTPKTWSKAFEICHAEQSYLATINSKEEANLLTNKLTLHPPDSLPGNFVKDGVYLGFSDLFTEGEFLTIKGEPLEDTGYIAWSPSQPDNKGNIEHCGHMHINGLLNDVNCTMKLMFFCEREVVNKHLPRAANIVIPQ